MINKNLAIILLIIGILITATCVEATMIISDNNMKQNTFDGIKINIPHDAEFIQTVNGFKENTYGITIYTFKDNQSMVNFLNGLEGVKIVSLNDQPPQSIAFTKGNTTNILVTNGEEGICVGAVDENLVIKMANSVIFSNGQPSERSHGFMGIGQKHLDKDKDFNLMLGLIMLVNNAEININSYNAAVINTVSQTNQIIDNSFGSLVSSSSTLWHSKHKDYLEHGSSSTNSDNSNTQNDESEEKDYLTQTECEQKVNEFLQGTNCSINNIDKNNGFYTFYIKDEQGNSAGVITVDSQTGEMNTDRFKIPDTSLDLEENNYPNSENNVVLSDENL